MPRRQNKFGEGFWVTAGTLAAQGLVESVERIGTHRHGHANNHHWMAIFLIAGAWGAYKLLKGVNK